MADLINTAEMALVRSHALFERASQVPTASRLAGLVRTVIHKVSQASDVDIEHKPSASPRRFETDIDRLWNRITDAELLLERGGWARDEYARHVRQMLVVIGAADEMEDMLEIN